MRQFTCPKAVTHPSTNRARYRATALIETNALPLHQTANLARTPKLCGGSTLLISVLIRSCDFCVYLFV